MTVQLIGINGNSLYNAWKTNLLLAFMELNEIIILEEVNHLEQIMDSGIRSIPAVSMNGDILIDHKGVAPEKEEFIEIIKNRLFIMKKEMKNMVVPIDFSEHSVNAFKYARALASKLEAELKVIHVCHPGVDTINGFTIPNMDELLDYKKEQLKKFVEEGRGAEDQEVAVDQKIDQELVVGFANDELIKISGQSDTDAIVIGTKGEGGLFEKIFGSVSSYVSRNARCPVWLIPPNVSFEGFDRIAFASNFEAADSKVFSKVLELSTLFDSEISLVHVTEDKRDIPLDSLALEAEFKESAPSFDIKVDVLEGEPPWKHLNAYVEKKAINLLVLLTRRRKFWDRLFHKSQTKELVLHAKVPILVLHFEE